MYMTITSFRLKVGDAVHDDMVKEQGFVVDLDVSGEQTTEVLHIPDQRWRKDTWSLLSKFYNSRIKLTIIDNITPWP